MEYSALIVDDEPAIRQATARALRGLGFRCDLAANGQQALQLLSENQYRLVLTDLRMPEVHGHRLAVEVLSKPDRPVIMVVTGVMDERLEHDLRERGVDEILFKPVDYSVMAARAKTLIESKAAERKAESPARKDASPITSASIVERDAPKPTPTAAAALIGDRLARALTDLPTAPPSYDTMREASKGAITSGDLNAAFGSDPPLAELMIRFINAAGYRSSERIDLMQRELAAARTHELRWIWPALAFSVGTSAGWLLAMLSR